VGREGGSAEAVPEGEVSPEFISIWTDQDLPERLGVGVEVAGCFPLDTVRFLGALGMVVVCRRSR